MWEDIARKFVESIEGRQDAPVHFLGAMVLDQKQTPVTHVEKRQVIDGQQRLTTFQIFLSALRDFCRAQACEELARECGNFIENRGMMADPEVDRFKVWPTQLDRMQFSDVVLSGSRKELEKRYPLIRRKWARYPDPRPRMIEAYLFFYEQLTDFFLGSTTEAPLNAEAPVATRLEECFQALKSSLQVVTIDLQPGDDPQVIFETLNARGEPLLPADLLRNYIFLRAARVGEDQEKLYDQFWRRFDDEFWRQEVKQGRLTRPRSDLFMQHFLASQIGEDIPVKHLFVEYKNWIERKHPFDSIGAELAELATQGDYFRRILEPTKGDPIWSLATFLESFDIRTAYPLLLMLLAADLPAQEWRAISAVIESYLLRRSVCRLNTKNYNRVFLSLTKNLRRDGVSVENLRRLLLGQSGESTEWPTDEEFKDAWLGEPAYDLGNAKLVHILTRLNETFLSEKTEPIAFDRQPTIEHIMPQQWIKHWPLPDGQSGLTSLELLTATSDDPRAMASEVRNRLVSNIGNLTILTHAMNSAQSNSSWNEKRVALRNHSLLPVNLALSSVENWDEKAIAARSEMLFTRAVNLWSRG